MNRKDYQRPTMEVIEAEVEFQILAGSYSMSTQGGREQLTDGADDISDWNE